MDNYNCANGIIEFLKNKNLQNKIINNMQITDYSNEKEIEKLYALI